MKAPHYALGYAVELDNYKMQHEISDLHADYVTERFNFVLCPER